MKLFSFKELKNLYAECKVAESHFLITLMRRYYDALFLKKNIIQHHKTIIKNKKNIKTGGTLHIGMKYIGFMHALDKTFLNVQGKLIFKGDYAIEKGCRIDIGKNAIVEIGKNGYINALTNLIIMHKLLIGDNTIISWNCQFLDEDFHNLNYEGKKEKNAEIIIGSNVWIGCNVKIYKGAKIPDGCVIASDSVVRNSFTENNVLIGGNPAKIIKRQIEWS